MRKEDGRSKKYKGRVEGKKMMRNGGKEERGKLHFIVGPTQMPVIS